MLLDMEHSVKLYVYDLSKGLAKSLSVQFIGKQIDGIWHTSVVYNNIEYFYGAGIQTATPGTTHHGSPLEVVDMGMSSLPADVVQEYISSLTSIYTPESYDLFMHNCNNFSQDLCQFLVGRDIPAHITGLPKEVLNTPFGQMMRPMLESSLRPITTAPALSVSAVPVTNSIALPASPAPKATIASQSSSSPHSVIHTTSASEIDNIISSHKAAVVFFTSSTCGPCRIAYQKYDELAEELSDKCAFVKVDINMAYDVSRNWNISATPTFMTFIDGQKFDEWKGASPPNLESNVKLLISAAYPPHSHLRLRVPLLLSASNSPVTYTRIPPLEKVSDKLVASGLADPSIHIVNEFISQRESLGSRETPLIDLHQWNTFIRTTIARSDLGAGAIFPLIDLLRVVVSNDVRVSSWYAEEADLETTRSLIVYALAQNEMYQLRLVTLQYLCNLFSCPLFASQLFSRVMLTSSLIELVVGSLLDTHVNVRVAASSLTFKMAEYVYRDRTQHSEEVLFQSDCGVELVVAILEGISQESESAATAGRLITALGLLVYCLPASYTDVWDSCTGLEAHNTIISKTKDSSMSEVKDVAVEVAQLFAAH
ncbi:PPPDE putative peptidase domain-containing protein [Lipomyces oligophaga]|uniref:PPPDE putative peptidase domain-containing protein n=1 Tax=Lipomyces oligophaga TaxID=45792 RepID=UPI0034CEE099